MIPHPTIPNFYIIPDYIAFQSIFFNSYQPIDHFPEDAKKIDQEIFLENAKNIEPDKYTILKSEK